FDRLVLAHEAAERRTDRDGAGFEARIGQALAGFDGEGVGGEAEEESTQEGEPERPAEAQRRPLPPTPSRKGSGRRRATGHLCPHDDFSSSLSSGSSSFSTSSAVN